MRLIVALKLNIMKGRNYGKKGKEQGKETAAGTHRPR